MTPLQQKDILDLAQQAILRRGWFKMGSPFQPADGTHCLLTAIGYAYGVLHPFRGGDDMKDAEKRRDEFQRMIAQDKVLMERIKEIPIEDVPSHVPLVAFNDHPQTTQQDIHDLIERTKTRLQ